MTSYPTIVNLTYLTLTNYEISADKRSRLIGTPREYTFGPDYPNIPTNRWFFELQFFIGILNRVSVKRISRFSESRLSGFHCITIYGEVLKPQKLQNY